MVLRSGSYTYAAVAKSFDHCSECEISEEIDGQESMKHPLTEDGLCGARIKDRANKLSKNRPSDDRGVGGSKDRVRTR